ncbi:alpha/beta fold hydrolase [Actinomadura montaniterrae]|nr:alpha/beta hydrolase [Actinomadura montaniterrae]
MRFLQEAAAAQGIDASGLVIDRIETTTAAGRISALRYGTSPPRLVALHGGRQNAHTWDLVMASLGIPSLALDLPGHGSSYRPRDYSPRDLAPSIAEAISELAPEARTLVGMSFGGMIALAAAGSLPAIRHVVLVDVSPGSAVPAASKLPEIRSLGPATLDDLVAAVAALSPGRALAPLRHSVFHATRPWPDTSSDLRTWRADPAMRIGSFTDFWKEMREQASRLHLIIAGRGSFVPDADRPPLRSLLEPDRLHEVPGSGHSIQSTRPRELAHLLKAAHDA